MSSVNIVNSNDFVIGGDNSVYFVSRPLTEADIDAIKADGFNSCIFIYSVSPNPVVFYIWDSTAESLTVFEGAAILFTLSTASSIFRTILL